MLGRGERLPQILGSEKNVLLLLLASHFENEIHRCSARDVILEYAVGSDQRYGDVDSRRVDGFLP